MLEKMCAYHKVVHPIEAFGKYSRSVDGYQYICKERRREEAVEYRKRTSYKPVRTPEQIMAYNLMKNYKLTVADYNDMVMTQCGLCAVCGEGEKVLDPRTGNVKKLAVHHNHNTGKIIALCCAECNMGMGKLKDNSIFLKHAADLMNQEGS